MLTDEEREICEANRDTVWPSNLLSRAALRLDAELDFAKAREGVLRGLLDETNAELEKMRVEKAL